MEGTIFITAAEMAEMLNISKPYLDLENNSFNLSVYMKLMDKMGVKMSHTEMYEDYQEIYDEKMKLSNDRIFEDKKQRRL